MISHFSLTSCLFPWYLWGMHDRKQFLLDQGYIFVRQLPDGRWIAVNPMITTSGLFVDLDESGYDHRYYYHSMAEALIAAKYWDGKDHPPGNWIVRKPHNYPNPNYEPRTGT